MIRYAAMDLLNGKVVRLEQGRYDMVTTYGDPYVIAEWVKTLAFDALHIINLNGAKNEPLRNLEIIQKLVKGSTLQVQVGGGIRDLESAQRLLDLGSDIILSTLFFEDFESFKQLCLDYPNRVALSLDLKDGCAMTQGWLTKIDTNIKAIAEKLEQLPLKSIIVTNIAGDGMLQGCNVPFFTWVASELLYLEIPLTAAGGVTTPEDIETLEQIGFTGAIVGKAIYEKGESVSWSKKESFPA